MNEKLDDFRQLVVWQKSHHLVIRIYEITKKFQPVQLEIKG
ncbi:MAG: four helix bundle protein [bacterium]